MMRPYLIFDLDGTLFDTSLDLARSVNFALAHAGLPCHEIPTIISFLGNGSLNLVRRSLQGMNDESLQCIHRDFLEHYRENCTIDIQPYPGVLEFLEKPGRISLLTNKPQVATLKILKHFGLQNRFEQVLCGDTTPERKPDPQGLLQILSKAQVSPKNARMVGDDLPDLGCARAAGTSCTLLLSGFGKSTELLAQHPEGCVGSFAEFVRLLDA
ncbi:MAG TPA: HAD-IA family hydrolase [Fibrobacteraceae bacterium]|nr:HAD-IA family hydrolase [Fibrobacteraceae bacterium]